MTAVPALRHLGITYSALKRIELAHNLGAPYWMAIDIGLKGID